MGLIVNRQTISWIVYDWATSPISALHITFIFSVYFTTILMPENGSFAWAMMSGITAFCIGVGAPILGRIADRQGYIRKALNLCTIAGGLATMALWFAYPDNRFAGMALGLSALSIFFTEMAFVYYNALLPHISPANILGRISGYGWGAGYIGAVIALLLVLVVLILPDPPLFGLDSASAEPVRLAMVFAGAWYLIFALPLMIYAPRQKAANDQKPFLASLRASWKTAIAINGMARFLLARMAYTDGLVTLFAFGGIYAAKVFAFSQIEILFFAICLNITAGIGAIIAGPLTDKIGPILIIRLSLIGLFLLGLVTILTEDKAIFWGAGIIIGIFVGPCQAAGRAWVGARVPVHDRASLFGLMAMSGKITSFAGPIAYGWLVYLSGAERAGMAVVLILFVIGFVLMPRRTDAVLNKD